MILHELVELDDSHGQVSNSQCPEKNLPCHDDLKVALNQQKVKIFSI